MGARVGVSVGVGVLVGLGVAVGVGVGVAVGLGVAVGADVLVGSRVDVDGGAVSAGAGTLHAESSMVTMDKAVRITAF